MEKKAGHPKSLADLTSRFKHIVEVLVDHLVEHKSSDGRAVRKLLRGILGLSDSEHVRRVESDVPEP